MWFFLHHNVSWAIESQENNSFMQQIVIIFCLNELHCAPFSVKECHSILRKTGGKARKLHRANSHGRNQSVMLRALITRKQTPLTRRRRAGKKKLHI